MLIAGKSSPNAAREDATGTDQEYLERLGERVREVRARRGMTRKILAKDSGVSERYLAQLEGGEGNVSILLLRQIAKALDMPLEVLILEGAEIPVDLVHTTEFLRRLDPGELLRAHQLLVQQFRGANEESRRARVALIGMRGAGKSTMGAMLAERLDVPFIELDRLIEQESGVSLSVIFELYGQSGYRRLERQCLDQVIERHRGCVLATGGSLVSEPVTFERLLESCYTFWLRATPEDHMKRVIAQGDLRPMAENRQAMSDLKGILAGREVLYRKADAVIDTSGHGVQENLKKMLGALEITKA